MVLLVPYHKYDICYYLHAHLFLTAMTSKVYCEAKVYGQLPFLILNCRCHSLDFILSLATMTSEWEMALLILCWSNDASMCLKEGTGRSALHNLDLYQGRQLWMLGEGAFGTLGYYFCACPFQYIMNKILEHSKLIHLISVRLALFLRRQMLAPSCKIPVNI